MSSEGSSGLLPRPLVSWSHDDLEASLYQVKSCDDVPAAAAAWAKTRRFLQHGKTYGDINPANVVVVRQGFWTPALLDLVLSRPPTTVDLILGGGRSVTVSLEPPRLPGRDDLAYDWSNGEPEAVWRRRTDFERRLHSERLVEELFYSSSTDVYKQDRREVKSASLWRLTNKISGRNLLRLIQRRVVIYLRRRSDEPDQVPTVIQCIDGIGLDHSAESHRSRAPSHVRKTQFLAFRELVPV